jgi:hypothetical protein
VKLKVVCGKVCTAMKKEGRREEQGAIGMRREK